MNGSLSSYLNLETWCGLGKKKKGRKKEVQITHNYFMPEQSDRTYLLILLSFGIFNTTCNILGVFAVSSMR